MISFANLDFMTRGGALALLTLWSWLLIRDHWRALPARIAVLMCLTIAGHIFATIPGPVAVYSPWRWLTAMGGAAVPGSFWLFARTWFNDEDRVGVPSWLIVIVPPIIFAFALAVRGSDDHTFHPIGAAMRVLSFILAAAGLWAAWRGRDGDLVEARRRIRARLVWAVGAFVILTNVAEIIMNNDLGPKVIGSLIEFGILGLTAALCAAMFSLRQADMFAPPILALAPTNHVTDDLATTRLALRLRLHMESERPYRDDTLTIAGLAAQLGEQEYKLRRLINGHLGYRNFAAFLNGYRLAEVKAALTDPSQENVPILTIALDAGFGSLGPFNRAFREAESMTPTAYKIKARA
jgi:AraC-like DNA-binding protein